MAWLRQDVEELNELRVHLAHEPLSNGAAIEQPGLAERPKCPRTGPLRDQEESIKAGGRSQERNERDQSVAEEDGAE